MPESFYDTVVVVFYTVVPVILILLQVFLSTRKRLIGGFVIPLLWSAFGAWMIIASRSGNRQFAFELFLFFLGGDIILFGILSFIRYWKRNRSENHE